MKSAGMDGKAPPGTEAERAAGLALRMIFIGLQLGMLILVVMVIRSGFYSVEPEKQALIFRFKALAGEDPVVRSGSGRLQWNLPRPFGQVLKLPSATTLLSTQSENFWFKDMQDPTMELSRDNGQDVSSPLVAGQDGYVICRDINLYHMALRISWRITDPLAFYRTYFGAEATDKVLDEAMLAAHAHLRLLAEQAVLHEIGAWTVDQAFYTDPEVFRQALEARLRQRVAQEGSGCACERVDIAADQRRPLRQLRGSFDSVTNADAEAAARIAKAIESRDNQLSKARTQAKNVIAQADIHSARMIERLGSRSRKMEEFLKVYDPKNPEAALMSFYLTTLAEAIRKVDKKYVLHSNPGPGEELRINIPAVFGRKQSPEPDAAGGQP